MNKIYFAGAVFGGRDDAPIYADIIKLCASHGEVLTEHLGHPTLSAQIGSVNMTPQEVYTRAIAWIDETTHFVAEVTQPSLGVGYEIAYTLSKNIPVICFYRKLPERRISSMLMGNPLIKIYEYSKIEEVKDILDKWF